MKPLKKKAWYKASRGGTRVLARKDYPLDKNLQERRDRQPGNEKKSRGVEQQTVSKEICHIVVETPVFIPYSKESAIKRRLQEVDELMAEATGYPAVRFVERCGGTMIAELLGRANPWAQH